MKKFKLLAILLLLSFGLTSCTAKTKYDTIDFKMTNVKYEKYYNVENEYKTLTFASLKPNKKDQYYIYDFKVKDSTKVIGSNSFVKISNYYSVELPESVFVISPYAFYNTPLKEINTEKIKYFQEYSFYCDSEDKETSKIWYGNHLPSLEIEYLDLSSAIVIEDNAFRLCTTKIKLSSSIKYIGDYAFAYSTISGEIYIPKTIEYIGKEAFSFQDGRHNTYVRFDGTLDEFLKLCPDSSWICRTEHSCSSKFINFTIVCNDKQVLVGDLYPDYLEFLNSKDSHL